jgi:hypothetical protein
MPAPRTLGPSGMPSGDGQKPHLVMPAWPDQPTTQQPPPPPGTQDSQAPVQSQAGPPVGRQ